MLTLGAAVATVYLRWRMVGVLLTGLGLVVVLLGIVTVVTVVTLTDSWPTVMTWVASLSIAQGFTMVLALGGLLALAGHAAIRRATPRS